VAFNFPVCRFENLDDVGALNFDQTPGRAWRRLDRLEAIDASLGRLAEKGGCRPS
jgi:hypothetical protein